MTEETKTCSECAEETGAGDAKCKHCGARRVAGASSEGTAPFLQRRISCFGLAAIFVGLPGAAFVSNAAFRWGPALEELVALCVFLPILLGGVLLIVRDLGRKEPEKTGWGFAGILRGCVGLSALWGVALVVLPHYLIEARR